MSAKPGGTVERLLADRIGLDPTSVGEGLIARGVHARMMALNLRSQADYEKTLLSSADELQSLIEEVVVPESWFFRDLKPFETLGNFARSGWLTDPARPPLVALSLPCAGGEEPYSIVLTLLEIGLPPDRFRVDAVDVSARSLARAIAGVYSSNAFRGPASTLRPKYFREQSGTFTLDPAVRSKVRFHLGNLLDSTLFADRPPFDVIFCRNLLIYFDREARSRTFATLGRLLVDGGLLFLGHADRADDSEASPFEPMGDKGSFAFWKGKPQTKPLASFRRWPRPTPAPARKVETKVPKATPAPVIPRAVRKKEEAPDPVASPDSGLERASNLADLGRYDEATRLVERVIAEGGASARAFFLLGLIDQAAGYRDRAEAHFLKAIYLDGQHDEALLSLAILARRRGDVAAESVYRRRAERVLARKGTS